jgi:hypothetical protein
MDGRTSRLETTFLKYQTIRSARLSSAVLEEFYLFYLARCEVLLKIRVSSNAAP